ncbi:MAG: hypothetical protein NMNS01_29940 [Nitrosomonas sp.]|jgi:ElaB/YqjD/DUF883 family membrane-anchored ribosome-binding protein|nr:MAG: hypothetical protein NMNS01_29940 [Nitrosomonas sp.]
MATNTKSNETQSDLREEFETLRTQVTELMQALKDKGEDKAERLGKKLESEFGHYQDKAERKLHDAYDAGEAGVDELSERVRKSPVTSLLVAFSAGYIISKILDNDK